MFWARCEQSHSAPPTSTTEPPTTHCHKGMFSRHGWKEHHHHHHYHHYQVDSALWGSVPQPKREHHHCHRSHSFRPWCDKHNSNIQADQMQHNRFHGHFHRFQDDAAAPRPPRWFSHCKSRRSDVPETEAQMFDYSENYN